VAHHPCRRPLLLSRPIRMSSQKSGLPYSYPLFRTQNHNVTLSSLTALRGLDYLTGQTTRVHSAPTTSAPRILCAKFRSPSANTITTAKASKPKEKDDTRPRLSRTKRASISVPTSSTVLSTIFTSPDDAEESRSVRSAHVPDYRQTPAYTRRPVPPLELNRDLRKDEKPLPRTPASASSSPSPPDSFFPAMEGEEEGSGGFGTGTAMAGPGDEGEGEWVMLDMLNDAGEPSSSHTMLNTFLQPIPASSASYTAISLLPSLPLLFPSPSSSTITPPTRRPHVHPHHNNPTPSSHDSHPRSSGLPPLPPRYHVHLLSSHGRPS